MTDLLHDIIRIVERAGEATLEHYHVDMDVSYKTDDSPLTQADTASHDIIAAGLAELTPDIPVISEEAALPPYEERKDWTRFWLVDPLDGTKEFVKRNDEFTVNVALIEDGVPILGAVLAPALDLLYYGSREQGSWKRAGNGEAVRIHASRPAAGQALNIVESRSHPSPRLSAYLDTMEINERIKVGSSLKFCYLAEGRADLYPRLSPIMEWDVAAGDCVYRYASDGAANVSSLIYNTPSLKYAAFIVGVPELQRLESS